MIPYIILGIVITSFIINYLVCKVLINLSKESKPSSLSGEDIAKRILGLNQVKDVKIEKSEKIGDNYYNPISQSIQLGPEVYGKKTVYSLTIGSHEACHAVDYNYFRFLVFKVNKFKKFIFFPAFAASFFLDYAWLHSFVLWSYIAVTAFYFLVEVCDELATNRRAYRALRQFQMLSKEEIKQVKKVQRVMNLTYVTGTPTSIIL